MGRVPSGASHERCEICAVSGSHKCASVGRRDRVHGFRDQDCPSATALPGGTTNGFAFVITAQVPRPPYTCHTYATHTLTVWRRPRGSLGAHAHAAAFTTTTAVEEGGIAAMYSAASFEARLLMSVDGGTLSSTRLLLQRSSVVHAPTDGPAA